jgi:hypothetical protein
LKAQLTLLPAIAAIVAAMVGCGGDGSSTSAAGSAETPTNEAMGPAKTAFIENAEAVCRRERSHAIGKVAAYRKAHRSEASSRLVLERAAASALLSTFRAEIVAIGRLKRPPGDEGEMEAILRAQQKALSEAQQLMRGSGSRRQQAGKTLADEVVERFEGGDEELRAYGLDGCAKGSES